MPGKLPEKLLKKSPKKSPQKAESTVVGLMTADQAALLKKIAFDAYEPEAFRPNLTRAEAERRIEMLQAKLKLMGEPPHTL
jgi:hypothetical protein